MPGPLRQFGLSCTAHLSQIALPHHGIAQAIQTGVKVKVFFLVKRNERIAASLQMGFFVVVLDGTEISLCGPDHHLDKSNQADCISAVSAMKFGHPVQVFQGLSVKDNEIRSPYIWNFVNRKTQRLVQAHKSIQQQQRKDDAVNHGPRDQVDGSGSFDLSPKSQLVIGVLHVHVQAPG